MRVVDEVHDRQKSVAFSSSFFFFYLSPLVFSPSRPGAFGVFDVLDEEA